MQCNAQEATLGVNGHSSIESVAHYKQPEHTTKMVQQSFPSDTGSDFLPNLCTGKAVFHLVIVGELLAIALTLSSASSGGATWYRFGLISMMIQWIVLASAACLCPLNRWFRHQSPEVAGGVSYGIVLIITAILTIVGAAIQANGLKIAWHNVYANTVIAAIFAGVVLRYFYLQQQLRNQQQSELQSRIQALQSRIRPHFLFNSMNSIASLIEIDPPLAESLIEDLSDLFRASLSEPGLVTLEHELDLCKRFSRIEQTRLGDRLQMNWNVEGSVNEVSIPSLLLQPLVENAIYHGIQPLEKGGEVDIDVFIGGGEVRLAVSNPVEVNVPKGRKTQGNGIALDNMRGRLEAYYGSKARTYIVAEAGRFSVQLQFPITMSKNQANIIS